MEIKAEELRNILENNILSFWLLRMQDKENGGFYGQIRGDGTLVADAPKGCILNGRILWAFSAAYRLLGKPEYLEAATRAKCYIIDHFIDREYGGVFWSVDCNGNPLDTKKQFYALGFVLYGMSEYVRATGDEDALSTCLSLFDTIEEHAYDSQYGGYIEALTRDWQPIEDMRLSDLDANYPKSQNTHLHIIEPYTNMLRMVQEVQKVQEFKMFKDHQNQIEVPSEPFSTIHNNSNIQAAVRRLIDIFCDKILNPVTHHLDLFFDMDWQRGAGRLESYGHDIECSWLLHEAAFVLGDEDVLRKVEPIVRLVARASEKGLNPDGSMTHEANLDNGYIDKDRHWWVQAETVVGFYNIYQHFGSASALQKAENCWQYIKDHLIDYDGGEWYWSADEADNINRQDDKAGFWKCPYHNSRMCLELIERMR